MILDESFWSTTKEVRTHQTTFYSTLETGFRKGVTRDPRRYPKEGWHAGDPVVLQSRRPLSERRKSRECPGERTHRGDHVVLRSRQTPTPERRESRVPTEVRHTCGPRVTPTSRLTSGTTYTTSTSRGGGTRGGPRWKPCTYL